MEERKLDLSDGVKAVSFARDAILAAFEKRPVKMPENLSMICKENRGLFVTLTINGNLRGCIGFPYPVMSVEEAIPKAAVAAAFDDPRFIPLARNELDQVCIELTVLTEPKLLNCNFRDYEKHIVIGKHGLIAVYPDENVKGLLLPQVATEYNVDAMEFLCMTAQKAGMSPMSWKYDAKIYTFEGQIFSETEPKGKIVEQTYSEKKEKACSGQRISNHDDINSGTPEFMIPSKSIQKIPYLINITDMKVSKCKNVKMQKRQNAKTSKCKNVKSVIEACKFPKILRNVYMLKISFRVCSQRHPSDGKI